MIPTIFAIGPFAIHSFGLMLVLSLFAAWVMLYRCLEAVGEDTNLAERMIFYAGVGGVVGARIAFLLSFPAEVAADPLGAIFGGAGFVFYGGLFGGAFAVYYLLHKLGKPFLPFADLSAPALSLGYAVGRIGCHLSGDGDYGVATELPWGFSYVHGVVPTAPGVLVHPTPVYETLGGLIITAILLSALREHQTNRVGYVFGFYLLLSAVARFLVEFLRIEPRIFADFTEAQLVSILLLVIGCWLMLKPNRSTSFQNSESGHLEVFPFAATVTLALALWGGGLMISHSLQNSLFEEQKNRAHSPQLVAAEKEAEKTPSSPTVQLALARARLREATENSDSKLLMSAVQSYKAVLDLDPKHADALLELARLCAQNGIYDKALDFFPRYLTLRPEDLDAESDYGLVYLQMGDVTKSKEIFSGIIKRSPKHFRAKLGLLLIAREEGNDKLAKELLVQVLELAPNAEVRAEVEKAFAANSPAGSNTSNEDHSQRGGESPAAQVTNYFKNHPIIGPKITALKWLDPKNLELRLSEFPIDKMPPEMRQLIASRAQERLQLSEPLAIRFVDDTSNTEFLAFELGHQATSKANSDTPLQGGTDEKRSTINPHAAPHTTQ